MISLAHHWLISERGGEKVLQSFSKLFPDAPIYTLVAIKDRSGFGDWLGGHRIVTSLLQCFPGATRHYYEGFGLPVLEAMSCSAPVICGRVCSLPEVAGGAACYSELNPVAFFEAMEKLYLDADYRKHLVELGRLHMNAYDWQHTAYLTYQVYRSMMS